MGAAAGKAVQDLASAADGTTTRADDRLAAAERVILEFERRRSSCDGTMTHVGIWDAQATCTNEGLVAAVDEIVFLKEMHAFPMASAAGRRMDGALRAAMSCLMEEFLSLRVCYGSQLEGRRGLRFAVNKLSVSLTVRAGVSSGTQSETRGVGAGVHPLTRYAVSCIESLAPHRGALDLILASTSGSLEGMNSFGVLFSELIASLEPNLEEISALRGVEGGGLRNLFLANNTSFVLKRAGALGGDDKWAACRRSRVEQHVAGYVEASWAPVVACLEAAGAGRPATKALAKFNAALEKAYSGNVRCEVSDPELRAALRNAVSEKVVGAYGAYLLEHPKPGKSGRYTSDSLAGLVSESFEGEDAAAR